MCWKSAHCVNRFALENLWLVTCPTEPSTTPAPLGLTAPGPGRWFWIIRIE